MSENVIAWKRAPVPEFDARLDDAGNLTRATNKWRVCFFKWEVENCLTHLFLSTDPFKNGDLYTPSRSISN